MTDTEQFLHLLNCIEPLSLPALHRLLAVAGSPEAAWRADSNLLRQARVKNAPDILAARAQIVVDQELSLLCRQMDQHGITLVGGEALPPQLQELSHPPQLLYCRGNVDLLASPRLIAVVGSRKATSYGRLVVSQIVPQLTAAGVTIVSGLALGIDAAAHKATLDAGGSTIAVLGSSLLPREITPPSHQRLAQELLAKGGLLISEYPPGSPGYASHFPERNRIIAGLCQGTVVVEAALKSGSLISARLASECSRDVFSVPGQITAPQSAGANELISRGAIPLTSCSVLFDALEWVDPSEAQQPQRALTSEETTIVEHCTNEAVSIDTLIERCNLPPHTVLSLVTQLTLSGILTETTPQHYQATL